MASPAALLEALPLAALHLKYGTSIDTLRAPRPEIVEQLSLRDYVRSAWHVVEPATPFVPGWHLDCIAEHLESVTKGELRNLIINIPPRHTKSLSVSVFWPTWVWTFAPAKRWLYTSYADTLSIRDSLKCRRLIQSPWYQERWGSVFALTGDQNEKRRFENDRTGYRIASSVGGSNTGEGGDYLVADDPHNIKEAESEVVREGVLQWWDEVMSTRLNDPKTGAKIIIMQRAHEDDLTGHLLASGGYHHLCLPARYEPRKQVQGYRVEHVEPEPHDDCHIAADSRTKEGELLWPERFGEPEMAALETDMSRQSTYAVAAQLQQRPTAREGALFKSDWFKPLPSDFDEPREDGRTMRQRLRIMQYWDLAFSEKQTADYTAAATVGADSAGNIYLLNIWRQRIQAVDDLGHVLEDGLPPKMAAHIAAMKPHLVGVEEGAFKQAATRDTIRLVQRRLAGQHATGITQIKVTTDKVFRAQLPAARAKLGMVYADRQAHWWPAFEAELLRFPKGSNDDQVDALAGACQMAVENAGYYQPEKPASYSLNGHAVAVGDEWDPFNRGKR